MDFKYALPGTWGSGNFATKTAVTATVTSFSMGFVGQLGPSKEVWMTGGAFLHQLWLQVCARDDFECEINFMLMQVGCFLKDAAFIKKKPVGVGDF